MAVPSPARAVPPASNPNPLLAFVGLLRASGLSISPAEAADAARALALLPALLREPATLRATLAGTLVKRTVDQPLFVALFDAYFLGLDPGATPAPANDHQHGNATIVGVDVATSPGNATDSGPPRHEHGRRIDLRRYFGDGAAGSAGEDHHAADRLQMTWLGRETFFDQIGSSPPDGRFDGGFSLRRLQTPGRPGPLRPDLAHGLQIPRDIVLRGLGDGRYHASEHDVDQHLQANFERAAATVRQMLRRRTAVDGSDPVSASASLPSELPDLSWDVLSAADLVRLSRAIARLGLKLGGAAGRRRPRRAGRLDAAATMRRAAQTDGLPLRPVFRTRLRDRPRLLVLCDGSLSVRGAARFLLHVTAAAQRGPGRVRSFSFVRDVAEITHLLQRDDLAAAIAAIFGNRLLDTAAASDGGAALRAFLDRYGNLVTPHTTLLILGDGRNNGYDPALEVLAELRRRARRLIWLSPEPRGTWQLAGCDLPRYARHCDILESVRTPAALERLVTRLAG